MDGQEYLDQISKSARATAGGAKASGWRGIVRSKYFLWGMVALAAFFVIVIIGAILGNGKDSLKEQMITLQLRTSRTLAVIHDYQPNVKSSGLRSSSASLYAVLSNTNSDLLSYLEDEYDYKERSADKDLVSEADLNRDELTTDLFTAKINGNLDRIYAHKMAYEISWVMSKETSILKSLKDETLRTQLATSYNSLENLYSSFDDFSETK